MGPLLEIDVYLDPNRGRMSNSNETKVDAKDKTDKLQEVNEIQTQIERRRGSADLLDPFARRDSLSRTPPRKAETTLTLAVNQDSDIYNNIGKIMQRCNSLTGTLKKRKV